MSRRAAARVAFSPGQSEEESKDERRKKACEELVLLGFKHLDGQDVLQAPFKPSALVEAVFTVAPDGKFKGMKFKKPEISASLKSLVAEGRLFAVQAHPAAKTGGAAKYSSYPMAPGSGSFSRSQAAKMNSGNGKVAKRAALAAGADIVGGLVVGTQAVQQWPLWPSPSATEACNLALKARTERDLARAESEALLAPTAAEAEANAEAAQLREADRRYGSREVKSRYVEVDGHTVLKANNYSLESGESSVWGQEVDKTIPPPRKPMTSYMIFSKKYREEHFPDPPEGKNSRKRKGGAAAAAAAAAAEGGGEGGEGEGGEASVPKSKKRGPKTSGPSQAKEQMDALVAAWRALDDESRAPYDKEAEEFKAAYEAEVAVWQEKILAQQEARQKMVRERRSIPGAGGGGAGGGGGGGSDEVRARRAASTASLAAGGGNVSGRADSEHSVSWASEVILALTPPSVAELEAAAAATAATAAAAAPGALPASSSSSSLLLENGDAAEGEGSSSTAATASAEGGNTTGGMEVDDANGAASSTSLVAVNQPQDEKKASSSDEFFVETSGAAAGAADGTAAAAASVNVPHPVGFTFVGIQQKLQSKNLERRWFELRAPLRSVLRRGEARRTLVECQKDDEEMVQKLEARVMAYERERQEWEAQHSASEALHVQASQQRAAAMAAQAQQQEEERRRRAKEAAIAAAEAQAAAAAAAAVAKVKTEAEAAAAAAAAAQAATPSATADATSVAAAEAQAGTVASSTAPTAAPAVAPASNDAASNAMETDGDSTAPAPAVTTSALPPVVSEAGAAPAPVASEPASSEPAAVAAAVISSPVPQPQPSLAPSTPVSASGGNGMGDMLSKSSPSLFSPLPALPPPPTELPPREEELSFAFLERVKLEAFLRQLVLARLQDCSLPQKAQVATSTLPELTLEATTIADMCVGLEAESAITLNKLKQSVQFGGGGARSSRGAGDSSSSMGEAAGGGAGDDEDGDYEGGEGGGGGSGGSSLPPLVYTEAAYFHPCGGWSRVKSGRRDVFRKDGVVPDVEVKTRAEIEEYEEKAGKFSKRPWLGQMIEMAPRPSSSSSMQGQESAAAPEPPQKVWEITPEALGPAIAYILGGLLKSGHVVTTQHNSNEGFMPSNLYTLGPPFPSAGKNRTEIARKEHNERLAADSARNSVSSAKYVAANLAICEPFLDPNLVTALKKRVGLVGSAGMAAAAQLKATAADGDDSGAGASAMSEDASGAAAGGAAAADAITTTTEEDGTLAAVAAAVAAKQTAMAPRGASGGGGKLSSTQMAQQAEAAAAKAKLEAQVDAAALPVMELPAPPLPQPSVLEGTMRPYQLQGLSWLVHCFQHGVNCILADEMGLGKTLQTIAFLTQVTLGPNPVSGPHLVIVPLSVLTSWVMEFRRFSPQLRIVRLHSGDEKERERLRREVLADVTGYDVVVTTYDMAVGSTMKHSLTRQWWRTVVLDEGHKIKNEGTDVSEACRKIRACTRVLLTGTPMQNNLHELWAMLNFLLPDIFVASAPFDSCFDLTKGVVDKSMLDKAHHLMQLFSLRRLKSEVEVSLPPKHELKISVPLSEFQVHFYRGLLMKDVGLLQAAAAQNEASSSSSSSGAAGGGEDDSLVLKTGDDQDIGGGAGGAAGGDAGSEGGPGQTSEWKRLQSLMMQLRKCCDHPYLFSGADPHPETIDESIVTASNKMVLLDRLLPKLRAGGHRVLIFSQFTSMLDILDDYCKLRGFEHARLDGGTNRVQRAIDVRRFNQDNSPLFIFLMSTRAGGLGINLQTADTVVLYDSDWNPQVDLQAIGRAHRIGQTKTVHVYRLISEGAVEERIYDRAQKKLFLSEMVNRDSSGPATDLDRLGKKELLQMLSFGADRIFNSAGRLPTEAEIAAIIDRSVSTDSNTDASGTVKDKLETWEMTTNTTTNDDDDKGALSSSSSSAFTKGTQNTADFEMTAQASLKVFQGVEYNANAAAQTTEDIAAAFHQSGAGAAMLNKHLKTNLVGGHGGAAAGMPRERKSRFVMHESGDLVLKANNYDVGSSSYEYETGNAAAASGGKAISKAPSKRQVAGRDYTHESTCLVCWDGGDVVLCDRCPAAYHTKCLGLDAAEVKALSSSQWSCPHHSCLECGRKAQAVGGLIFRCECCPKAYCEDHLPMEADIRGRCVRFEELGMRHPDQACYITCGSSCLEWARDHVYKPEEEEEEEPAPAKAAAAKGSKKTKAKGRESGGSAAKRART